MKPRKLLPVALVLASIPVLSLAEAALDYIHTLQGDSSNHFGWMFRRYLMPWALLALCVPIPVLLARRFPFGRGTWLRSSVMHVLGGVLFGTAHLFLDVLVGKFWWHGPIPLLGGTINLISWYLLRDLFIYGMIVGTLQAFWYRRALHEREVSESRLRADLASARLAALQARFEPHFLFNTLNTAVMLVRDDRREEAVNVLVELSELLRAVVRESPAREVPLAEEWEFLRRYLALEQARFQERLTVRLEQDPGLDAERVPFLILQPLVENAIRHGIAKQAGPGYVRVSARREANSLRLEVADNGAGPLREQSLEREGIGLASVRARLRELYGAMANGFSLERNDGETVATVLLPRD